MASFPPETCFQDTGCRVTFLHPNPNLGFQRMVPEMTRVEQTDHTSRAANKEQVQVNPKAPEQPAPAASADTKTPNGVMW